MSRFARFIIYIRVIKELLCYDLMAAIFGFKKIHKRTDSLESKSAMHSLDLEACVHQAMRRIAPFYWKPVMCLQRSVVTARVLRAYGTQAEVVIGCQLAPFLSHAWVEVSGRIVNDSPAFQQRLQVLERF